MDNLAAAGFGPFKISVVVTRQNVEELDALAAIADSYGAQLRLTRLRPSGRAVDTWDALHPTAAQQRTLYHWLLERPGVLTGDSFFHLSALGEPLDGLNLCGAGRVVCLIDPVGDVYACPFVIDRQFLAGNVRDAGGFPAVWRESALFTSLREPQSAGACASCGSFDACRGGCMAAKFFTGLPLDGPDPECVHGHGEAALAALGRRGRSRRSATPRSAGTGRRCRCPRPSASARRPAPEPVELAGATWPQVEATGARTVLAVPLGSLEQHGPHLPLDTDTRIAVARGRRGWRRAVRASPWRPPWPTGPAASTPASPARSLVGHEVLADLLVELVRSARRSFAGVVFVNAHGGNEEALAAVRARAAAAEGDDVLVWRAVTPGGDAHAGRTETSLMLAIDPAVGAPRAGRARLHRAARARCCPVCAPKGCGRYRPTACWVIPTGASAEEGRALLDALVRDLAAAVSSHWSAP